MEDGWSLALVQFSLVSSLGGLLFGFDTGVVSGALLIIGSDLTPGRTLTILESEWIVSSALIGALIGSLGASQISLGRKPLVVIAAVFFLGGAILQGLASTLWHLVAGRVIVGLAVGLDSTIIPIYISELSPAKSRGSLVCLLVVMITFGQVVAYIVDAIFYTTVGGWRYCFGFGALPALLQLGLSFSLPESPRFDISVGNFASAKTTLSLIYPNASLEIDDHLTSIRNQLTKEREESPSSALTKNSFFNKCWKNKPNRRALILACGLQLIQQITGFNTIMYYSGSILKAAHFDKPLLFGIFIASANFIFTIIALRLIDRTLLLFSLSGMITGMFFMGLSFQFLPPLHPPPPLSSSPSLPSTTFDLDIYSNLALMSTVFFCTSYALGLGNIPWIVQSEIFHFELRTLGSGLSTGINWSGNLIVASTFLSVSQGIGPSKTFWLYGLVSIFGLIFVYFYLPETKGLDLEAVRVLFMREEDDDHSYEAIGEEGVSEV